MALQIKLPRFGKDARLGLALALLVALIMGGLALSGAWQIIRQARGEMAAPA